LPTLIIIVLFSMFIALWNSMIKAEYPDDHNKFNMVYSHSQFLSGFAQLIVTLFITSIAPDGAYGYYLTLYGSLLMAGKSFSKASTKPPIKSLH
jgi:hypothetical protein